MTTLFRVGSVNVCPLLKRQHTHTMHALWHSCLYLYLSLFFIWCYGSCVYLSVPLKELEHRKLGWKVLILKSDLCKSFSKEMWCKMADTEINFTTYFKRWKMHVIWGKSFLCRLARKWFPLIMNSILVCAHFSSKLAHGTYCLCSITQLFRLFRIV